MTGIAEWLLAQYDAVEKRERAKYRPSPAAFKPCPACAKPVEWVDWHDNSDGELWWVTQPCVHRLSSAEVFASVLVESAPDPGVLADLAAKRRIVELHMGNHECVVWCKQTAEDIADGEPPRTRTTYVHPEYIHASDPTLRLLASALSDRPGFDPAWAVEA